MDVYCRYSYAIVGINLTEMAYSLLKSGALKSHFYNAVPGLPNIEHFHQFYCEYLTVPYHTFLGIGFMFMHNLHDNSPL